MSRRSAVALGSVLLLLLCRVPDALAQGLTYGVKGGVTNATLDIQATDLIISPSARIGAEAGVYVTHKLFGPIDGQIEGLLSQKGTVLKDDPRFAGDVKVRITYLDVPALLGYRVALSRRTALHALGGGVFSFRISDKQLEGSQELEEGVKQAFTSTDVGLSVGGAISFGQMLVDVRYVWGLTNINNDVDRDELTVRNRTLSVTVGLRLR
jgi:outer membrane protein with beta-barrel domain